jgi:hypothetical protein
MFSLVTMGWQISGFFNDLHIKVPNSMQLTYVPVLMFCASTHSHYDGFPLETVKFTLSIPTQISTNAFWLQASPQIPQVYQLWNDNSLPLQTQLVRKKWQWHLQRLLQHLLLLHWPNSPYKTNINTSRTLFSSRKTQSTPEKSCSGKRKLVNLWQWRDGVRQDFWPRQRCFLLFPAQTIFQLSVINYQITEHSALQFNL